MPAIIRERSHSLYREIASQLGDRVRAGHYGERLPTLQQLADEFDVGMVTMSRAVKILQDANVVTAAPGRGICPTRLRRERTHMIGAVFGGIGGPLGAQFAEGMHMVADAAEQGLTLSSYGVTGQSTQMERIRNLVERNQVDGLVLWLVGEEVEREAAAYLKDENIPFVLVPDYDPVRHRDVHAVSGADAGATADIMTHLLGQGHRDILFAGDWRDGETIYHRHRYGQYRRSLEVAGLNVREGVRLGDSRSRPEQDAALLEELRAVTAVFCESDRTAILLHRVCVREGIRVPDELAIVGFDNSEIARGLDLTSVEQHFERIGQKAVELLLDDIDGNLKYPIHLEVESELVIRGSSVKTRHS